jgi:hypothetical protein
MTAVQLKFCLRTSSNVKTVHLLGSWDNYSRQIPLSRDDSKPGSWVGKFRFQTSMLKLGGRYWYYVSIRRCWMHKERRLNDWSSILWMDTMSLMILPSNTLLSPPLAASSTSSMSLAARAPTLLPRRAEVPTTSSRAELYLHPRSTTPSLPSPTPLDRSGRPTLLPPWKT